MSVTKTRQYQITIILDTRGYEEPVETLLDKVSATLTELGAEVTEKQNLGRHEFVRVTDKDHPGDTYLLFKITGDASTPEAFQERVRLDRTVKRVMVESI